MFMDCGDGFFVTNARHKWMLERIGRKREVWRWTAKEDRKLILLIKRRGFSLRIKPFEKNDEVQKIAEGMGRSYEAVHKRIQRLRNEMKCPSAAKRRKA